MINRILSALMTVLLSVGCSLVYRITRKTSGFSLNDAACWKKLIVCLIYTLSMNFMIPETIAPEIRLFYFLLELISDIDILLMKIPTELVFVLSVVTVWNIILRGLSWPVVFIALSTGLIWYIFRKKTGIAVYDVILIVLTAMQYSEITGQLLFQSFILILWGATGIIAGKISGSAAGKRIPLAPVITAAFLISVRLY